MSSIDNNFFNKITSLSTTLFHAVLKNRAIIRTVNPSYFRL
ncbi:hypothetical protein CSC12_5217 [Klebsiella michiganensis]|nr:hypothetical protein CSC12_5217 [Klebsiella michiganensis]